MSDEESQNEFSPDVTRVIEAIDTLIKILSDNDAVSPEIAPNIGILRDWTEACRNRKSVSFERIPHAILEIIRADNETHATEINAATEALKDLVD